MKWKLNHLPSSLKRGWPFGTPSCGRFGEGGFHTSCIIFVPVQMTVQAQPCSKAKTSWAESVPLQLRISCCWAAHADVPVPLQAPVPSGALLGAWQWEQWAGLCPSFHAGLHSTYWDPMTILLEIKMRWHKTGTSGRFSRMDQLQIPLLVNLASKPLQQMFVLRHWMLSGCFFPLPPRSKCQHNGNSHKLTDQH